MPAICFITVRKGQSASWLLQAKDMGSLRPIGVLVHARERLVSGRAEHRGARAVAELNVLLEREEEAG